MGDIQFVEMPVEEISSDNGRTVVKSGGQFYSFFQQKKDGQPSRAQSDFEKLNLTVGNTYSFGITENVKQMPDGKTITFRNIALISEARGGQQQNTETPANTQAPQASQAPQGIPDPQEPKDLDISAF